MTETGKLTASRKKIVDEVLYNLEHDSCIWKKGWRSVGNPESGTTGTEYSGINAFTLSMISASRGYSDSRWVTFQQMKKNGWFFKKDENGKSLGIGAGVQIEYYDVKDKNTGQQFDIRTLAGMDSSEKNAYMRKNVFAVRRTYTVFNASLIDGIEERVLIPLSDEEASRCAEAVIKYWSENEARIVYEGNEAYYSRTEDKIVVPRRSQFGSTLEFYQTIFHEMSHSTGHEKRLRRDLSGMFGVENYAIEELRAEIAAMFLQEDLGIEISHDVIRNNSGYIRSWIDEINSNPQYLFEAIKDADRIAKYIYEKAWVKEISRIEANDVEKKDNSADTILADNEALETSASNDIKIIKRLCGMPGGDVFKRLYSGENIYGNREKSMSELARRVSVLCTSERDAMRLCFSSRLFKQAPSIEKCGRIVEEAFGFTKRVLSDNIRGRKSGFSKKMEGSRQK